MNLEQPRTRAEILAEHIELSIVNRGLEPGDPIGTIGSWAEETGYAKPTVREAVRAMVARGTVDVRPGRSGGLFVASSDPVLALTRAFLLINDSAKSHGGDVLGLLHVLEPVVAAEAARRRTDLDIEHLRGALERFEAARGDQRELMRRAEELRRRIGQITSNPWLKVVYISLSDVFVRVVDGNPSAHRTSAEDMEAILERYHRLVDAIVVGDPELASKAGAELHQDHALS